MTRENVYDRLRTIIANHGGAESTNGNGHKVFSIQGGESCGIHQALGENIQLYAVNHWEVACNTHALNFPADETICQDIQTLIPTDLVEPGTPVELLWASPECTNFSVAKGGRPLDNQSRCTPFDILRWVSMLDVKRLIVENVPEFESWGELDGKTQRPIEKKKGGYFSMFIGALRQMGYTIDWRVCNAADFGAPTTRRRLFIQGVKKGSGKRLVWPSPTHSARSEGGLFDSLKPWVPARDIIDWSIPCPAIDDREKPLAPKTMQRILNGIAKYWGDYAKPFLVRYNGGENRFHSIDEPVPVLDTSNRYGLVEPLVVEFQRGGTCKPVKEPLSTIRTSGAHHGLIEPFLVSYYGNGTPCPISEPVGTLTTKDRYGLVSPQDCRIGFRMLQPHELAAAQSFPKEYRFTGTKGDVVKQIGNAVCPKMAEALVGA